MCPLLLFGARKSIKGKRGSAPILDTGVHTVKPLIGRLGIIVTLIFATQSCFAGAKSAEPATITGTIRVVGNEPFTHVVLTPGDHADNAERNRDCLIIGPLAEELRRHHQGHIVVLEGMTCASPAPEFTQCFNPTRIVNVRNVK